MAPERKKGKDFVTREYTVHLSKYMKGIAFKRRAPQAIKTIKRFAQKAMKTSDVRLDVRLNKAVWSQVCGRRLRKLWIVPCVRRNKFNALAHVAGRQERPDADQSRHSEAAKRG